MEWVQLDVGNNPKVLNLRSSYEDDHCGAMSSSSLLGKSAKEAGKMCQPSSRARRQECRGPTCHEGKGARGHKLCRGPEDGSVKGQIAKRASVPEGTNLLKKQESETPEVEDKLRETSR